MSAEEWDRIQDVNLRGAFLFAQAAARQMISQGGGGSIINIGSIDSFHPSMVGLAAYDASKGGLRMFNKNFALEVAPHGIRVNLVAPGAIATEGVGAGTVDGSPERMEENLERFLALIPMKRMGVPDEIAMMTLVLATPIAEYMTGAEVIVDGGRLLS
jgi:2-dehydro-3-deoxy-D-gluconate 5-dehydrogenase